MERLSTHGWGDIVVMVSKRQSCCLRCALDGKFELESGRVNFGRRKLHETSNNDLTT